MNGYVLAPIPLAKPRQNLRTSEKEELGKIVPVFAVYAQAIQVLEVDFRRRLSVGIGRTLTGRWHLGVGIGREIFIAYQAATRGAGVTLNTL